MTAARPRPWRYVAGIGACLILAWFSVVRDVRVPLLGLVDLEGVADYLPGRALSSFDGTEDGGLSKGLGGAVSLAWVTGLGLLGYLRMSRQDVT